MIQNVKLCKKPRCFVNIWRGLNPLDLPRVEKAESMSGRIVEIKSVGIKINSRDIFGKNNNMTNIATTTCVLNSILVLFCLN